MAKITLSQNTCSVQTGHIFFLVIRNTIGINRLAKDLCHSLHTRFIIIFTLFWRKIFVNKGRVFSFSCKSPDDFELGMVCIRLWKSSRPIQIISMFATNISKWGLVSVPHIMIWSRMVLTRDLNAENYSKRLLTTSIWYTVDHISFITLRKKSVTNSFTEFEFSIINNNNRKS